MNLAHAEVGYYCDSSSPIPRISSSDFDARLNDNRKFIDFSATYLGRINAGKQVYLGVELKTSGSDLKFLGANKDSALSTKVLLTCHQNELE